MGLLVRSGSGWLCLDALDGDTLQTECVIMIVRDYSPHGDTSLIWGRVEIRRSIRRGTGERPAEDKPDPWDLLLYVDSLHVLPIGGAGHGRSYRVAVVDSNHPPGLLQINVQQFDGIKLKVRGGGKDVSHGYGLCDTPVPLLVHPSQQRSTGFNLLASADVQEDGLPRRSAEQNSCCKFSLHILSPWTSCARNVSQEMTAPVIGGAWTP